MIKNLIYDTVLRVVAVCVGISLLWSFAALAQSGMIIRGDLIKHSEVPLCVAPAEALHYDTSTREFSCASIIADAGYASLPFPANNTVMVGNGSTWVATTLPSCSAAGQALQYNNVSHTFSCVSLTLPDGGWAWPTESSDMIPLPEGRMRGDSMRVLSDTLVGGTFYVRRRVTFNRILLRTTNQVGSPTMSFGIYQATGGGSGVAARIATVTAFPVSIGPPPTTLVITPSEGTVTIEEGLFFVLYGRDSVGGSITLRTYTTEPVQLMTAAVDTELHPTTFTTAISAAALPATFDPRQTPTGSASATSTDVLPITRLFTQ